MSRVEERLRIEADNSITAFSGKMDYGQGLRAAYARIIADELGGDASRVHVVLGDTDLAPWDMGTFGSMSVEMDGLELRRAAAYARALLIERAAARLDIPVTELEVKGSAVREKGGKRAISFDVLACETPLTGAVPDSVAFSMSRVPLSEPNQEVAIGIVTGHAEFAGDVRLAGMLEGAVLHPPEQHARLSRIDRDAAMRLPGVVAVIEQAGFVGVVARLHEQAVAARKVLNPVWNPPSVPPADPIEIALRNDPGADDALASARTRLSARYFTPHISAAPLGPSVGVADVGADHAVIYGTTQVPFRLRDQVASIAGLPAESVHFKPRAMSGGFGRHGASDATVEAARLSKAVGRPVRVQWERDDELQAAPHRAEMTADLEAGLDDRGRIIAWHSSIATNPYTYDASGSPERDAASPRPASGGTWGSSAQMAAMMAGRNGVPPYEIHQADIRLRVKPAGIRTGALRSLGATPNVFAIESFIDELAHATDQDPISFRLAHARDARLSRVLEIVRERSGWPEATHRHGLGVACVVYRHTYVAEVAEVSVSPNRDVRLERVWCAVDAGHIVDADGARNQIEGAVQMAASWALIEALPHRNGQVTASTWADYPIATFRDAPRTIDIAFTGEDSTPSSGLGEPPAVPMAAAIANAVFAACGARVRELPIRF